MKTVKKDEVRECVLNGETVRVDCECGGYYLIGPNIWEHNGKGVTLNILEESKDGVDVN